MRLFNICSVSVGDVNHDALSRSVSGSVSRSQQLSGAIRETQHHLKELGQVGFALAKLGPMVNAAGEVGRTIQSQGRGLNQHLVSLVDLEKTLQTTSDQITFLKRESKKPACLSQSQLSKSEASAYASLRTLCDTQAMKKMMVEHKGVISNANTSLEVLRSALGAHSNRSRGSGSTSENEL